MDLVVKHIVTLVIKTPRKYTFPFPLGCVDFIITFPSYFTIRFIFEHRFKLLNLHFFNRIIGDLPETKKYNYNLIKCCLK